ARPFPSFRRGTGRSPLAPPAAGAGDERAGRWGAETDRVAFARRLLVHLISAGRTRTQNVFPEKQREEPKPADAQNVNEEYKIWKKNSPFLYDLLVTQSMEWPSLTFQWLPDHYSVHRFFCGTYTSGAEPEFLQIAEVHLPGLNAEVDARKFEEDKK
ncbi:MAG: histone-binding protein RBBP4 or subunit C of CAF1 complex-domain-containing protein, partial [Olpidium bornovanus]